MYNRFNDKHGKLIKVMKAQGYKTDEKGTCGGLTGMYIRDVLAKEKAKYDARIELVCGDPKFNDKLKATKTKLEKVGLATQKYTIEISTLKKLEKILQKYPTKANLNLDSKIKIANDNRAKTQELELKKYNFSSMDEKNLECLPFFEAVEITQQPGIYENHLGVKATQSSVAKISEFVTSVNAEKSGDTVVLNSHSIQKHFNRLMLQHLCDELFLLVKANKLPVVFEIDGTGHTISIHYDEEISQNSWIFFDSNQMPAYPVPSEKISYYILEGLYTRSKMEYVTPINVYTYHTQTFTMPGPIQATLFDLKNQNFLNKKVISEIQKDMKDQSSLETILDSFPAEVSRELFKNFDKSFLEKQVSQPVRLLKYFNKIDSKDFIEKLDIDKLLDKNRHSFNSDLITPENKMLYISCIQLFHLKYSQIFITNSSLFDSIIFKFDKKITPLYGIEKMLANFKNELAFIYEETKDMIIIRVNAFGFKKFIIDKATIYYKKHPSSLSQNLSTLFSHVSASNDNSYQELKMEKSLSL